MDFAEENNYIASAHEIRRSVESYTNPGKPPSFALSLAPTLLWWECHQYIFVLRSLTALHLAELCCYSLLAFLFVFVLIILLVLHNLFISCVSIVIHVLFVVHVLFNLLVLVNIAATQSNTIRSLAQSLVYGAWAACRKARAIVPRTWLHLGKR